MSVLWLFVEIIDKYANADIQYTALTFINRSSVSINVGMGCLGSLMVRACTMPSVPYQFVSRINPVNGIS
jgi:hypothetical protein